MICVVNDIETGEFYPQNKTIVYQFNKNRFWSKNVRKQSHNCRCCHFHNRTDRIPRRTFLAAISFGNKVRVFPPYSIVRVNLSTGICFHRRGSAGKTRLKKSPLYVSELLVLRIAK